MVYLRLRVCFNNLTIGVFPFDCHHIFKMSHFVPELHGVNPFIFDCPPRIFPLTVHIYGVVSSSKVVVTNLHAQSLKSVLGCCGFIHSLSPTCDFTAFKSHVYCVYIWCSVFIEGRRHKLACPVSQERARLLWVYPLIVSNM